MNTAFTAPPVPSVTVTSLMLIVGPASSLAIVAVALAAPSVAPVGPLRVTENDSFGSRVASPRTSTTMAFEVSPARNVSVPDVAVKSVPAAAVPPTVV